MADRAPLNFDEFKAKTIEDGSIPFVAGGKTFTLLPPQALSDEDASLFLKYQAAEARGETVAPDAVGRLIVDDYDGFVAVGGSALMLLEFMESVAQQRDEESKNTQGVTEGESAAS